MRAKSHNISEMKLVRIYGRGEPFACFDCRKSFKRNVIAYSYFNKLGKALSPDSQSTWPLRQQENRRCPDCGKPAVEMGIDFKPPRTSDARGWKKVEAFIHLGKRFYRGSQMPENIRAISPDFETRRSALRNRKKALK